MQDGRFRDVVRAYRNYLMYAKNYIPRLRLPSPVIPLPLVGDVPLGNLGRACHSNSRITPVLRSIFLSVRRWVPHVGISLFGQGASYPWGEPGYMEKFRVMVRW